MSSQVYASGGQPPINRIIGELVGPTPDGGITVKSLTISDIPPDGEANAEILTRNAATGEVEVRAVETIPDIGVTHRFVSAPQTTPNNATHDVLFPDQGAAVDPGVVYNAGTGEFAVQALSGGVFDINWTVVWAANATGMRWTWLEDNAGPGLRRYGSTNAPAVTGQPSARASSVNFALSSGSTFRIKAFQTSGGNLDIVGTALDLVNFTNISVTRIRTGAIFATH